MNKIYISLLLLCNAFAQGQILNIPNIDFKNALLSASPTNYIAHGDDDSEYITIDTNGNGEIEVSEALQVKGLVLVNYGITDLTGIQGFVNLTSLISGDNSISNFSVNGMQHLQAINIGQNVSATSYTFENLPALKFFLFYNSNMVSVTLNNCPSIEVVDVSQSSDTSLHITGSLPNFLKLACDYSLITDLVIDPAPKLKEINASYTALTNPDIANYPLLQTLDLSYSGLVSTAGLQNLPKLMTLNVSHTAITNVDINNYPLLNSLDVSYSGLLSTAGFLALNKLKYLDVSYTHITTLPLPSLPLLEELNCRGNGLIEVNTAAMPKLRYLKAGNNQLTALQLSANPLLSYLEISNNPIAAMDFSGYTKLSQLYCSNTLLTELDLSHNRITDISFAPNGNLLHLDLKDGRINKGIVGFSDFLRFADNSFEGLSNLSYICVDEGDIVQYTPSAVNPPAALLTTYCTFTPGGIYNTITGTPLFDYGNNGCDPLVDIVSLLKVSINDGVSQGASFTNSSGKYKFFTGAGTFTVAPQLEKPAYFTVSPSNAVVQFPLVNNAIATNDFCLTANGSHQDLEVVIAPVTPARPGFDGVYKIVYHNKGNQAMSLGNGLSFTYNQDYVSFVSASTTPSAIEPGTLAWDYAGLKPFESRSILVTLHINTPTEVSNPVNIGDVLDFNGVIFPVAADEEIADNYSGYHQTVVGSFDPNDIYCVEGDIVPPSEIGQYLHYIINFENTGNYPAENIVVKEMIDTTRFDLSSLQFLDSSHPVDIRLHDNIAEMIFQNINLDTGGHGNVMLKIKSKGDLIPGSTVSKNAKIFFDYNAPVSTNMASTLFQALSVPGALKDASISVFPVPARDSINIQADNAILSVEMYDSTGRLLEVIKQNGPELKLDISQRASGTYFLKIRTEKGISVEKAVKQ